MFGFFNVDKEKLEKSKEKILATLEKKDYWDASNYKIDLFKISADNSENELKYEELKEKNNAKASFYKILLISILIGVLMIGFSSYTGANLYFFALMLMFGLPSWYHSKLKKLGKDLVKVQIANKKNWIYMPSENSYMWRTYATVFSEVFSKGDESQSFEDVFLGDFERNMKNHKFVAGNFSYYTVSTDSEGRRHRTRHDKHFFSIKLPKNLESRFFIYPESVFSKIGNFFTKKEINLESSKFNKIFAFKYSGKKDEKSLDIVKTLSPRVQEELVSMYENGGKGLEVLFTSECVVFSFDGVMMPKMKTDFIFNSLNIEQEDIDTIEKKLSILTDISSEMVKYLD